jgi:hypothetical protein
MKYHAPTKQFVVSKDNFDYAALSLVYSIQNIRKLANLPMAKYAREGLLTPADHAQKGLLDAAKAMGIDLGADWGNDLDVTEGI